MDPMIDEQDESLWVTVQREGEGYRLSTGHHRVEALRTAQAGDQTPPEGVVVLDGDWVMPVDVRGCLP